MYTGHKHRNETDWRKWMEIWDDGERGLSCGDSKYGTLVWSCLHEAYHRYGECILITANDQTSNIRLVFSRIPEKWKLSLCSIICCHFWNGQKKKNSKEVIHSLRRGTHSEAVTWAVRHPAVIPSMGLSSCLSSGGERDDVHLRHLDNSLLPDSCYVRKRFVKCVWKRQPWLVTL